MSDRQDVAVAEKYPSPAPGWYSPWQLAIVFAVNDSSMRRQIEAGKFPGAVKDWEGNWRVPRLGLIARLQAVEIEDSEKEKARQRRLEEQILRQRNRPMHRDFTPGPQPPKPKVPPLYQLYRWYDEPATDVNRTLLYIGQSQDAPKRSMQHIKDKPWKAEAVYCEIEKPPYPTQDAVNAAERSAIQTEQPKYNKVRYISARATVSA